MKVYLCTDHDSFYIAGASLVVAPNEEEARALLDAALMQKGLKGLDESPYTLTKVSTGKAKAVIIADGDY